MIRDFIHTFKYFIESNLRNLATLLNVSLPYIMFFIGQYVFDYRGKITVGTEILIPIAVCFIIYIIRSYANKIGKGTTIPVPNKRFTEEVEGEVSVENSRVQELILYLADLEDWFERKGLL